MSTVKNNQASWTNLAGQQLDSKYEKCRNITEEIYKRINITFQIKKLETGEQSDISVNSDQIDSNELSNETDLFACDKSDISSSTEAERTTNMTCAVPAFNNNNNNEERNKPALYKKPRKRFRKRVKKRPPNRKRSDSEGSSDEAPLSRSMLILSPDLKPKLSIEKEPSKKSTLLSKNVTLRELLKPTDYKLPTVLIEKIKRIDKEAVKKSDRIDKKAEANSAIDNKNVEKNSAGEDKIEIKDMTIDKGRKIMSMAENEKRSKDVKVTEWKNCSLCSLSFRGERGLRRHISMSHITIPEGTK